MEAVLRAYLDGSLPPNKLEILYHIGDALTGETDFRLQGSGNYQAWATVTKDRQRRDYVGQLAKAEVEELVRKILSLRLWDVTHVAGEQGLDNPEARIVVNAGNDSFPAVLWISEIEATPAFDAAQEAVLALIRYISGGEVWEVGR